MSRADSLSSDQDFTTTCHPTEREATERENYEDEKNLERRCSGKVMLILLETQIQYPGNGLTISAWSHAKSWIEVSYVIIHLTPCSPIHSLIRGKKRERRVILYAYFCYRRLNKGSYCLNFSTKPMRHDSAHPVILSSKCGLTYPIYSRIKLMKQPCITRQMMFDTIVTPRNPSPVVEIHFML